MLSFFFPFLWGWLPYMSMQLYNNKYEFLIQDPAYSVQFPSGLL